MALAYLSYRAKLAGHYHLQADIGSSKYYQYLIGSKEQVIRENGIKALANAGFVSPLQMAAEGFGGLEISIPQELIDRENRLVQLLSYRTQDKVGPALSEVLTIPLAIERYEPYEITMNATIDHSQVQRRKLPISFREVNANQMSFNWMQLFQLLPSLLENATPIVQTIGQIVSGANRQNGSEDTMPPGGGISPEVIRQLLSNLPQQPAAASPAVTSAPQAASLVMRSPASQAMDGGLISGPLLAAILPQLLQVAGPALQQVLSPETIHALGDPAQVNQLMTHLMDSMLEADRVRQESMDRNRANRLNFFRQANPILQQYLQGRAAASSLSKSTKSDINIEFAESKPVTLMGKPRIMYNPDGEIRFPFTIDGIESFPQAIAQIRLITTESNTPVLERKFRIKSLTPGETDYSLKLAPVDLQDLPRDEDILLDLILRLRSEEGKVRSVRKIHRFRISPNYIFDRVIQQTDTEIPLNDVVQYREYWHKLWEADIKKEVRRYYLEGKYYTLLDTREESDAIFETKIKPEPEQSRGHRAYLKFKSGMQFSIYKLNNLLPQLSGQQMLSPELLEAIQSPEVSRHFQKAARAQAEFKGSPGETVTLWAYPVLAMHEIILKRPEESDINGQVVRFSEEVVDFPVPVSMHFVGTISEVV